ncbi:MAG: hypothetical protein N7Q72_03910, partial [Spiroplasma sp. Tabriz.8]|nr:hypothetical protein [Spiroplasma sp. Tabriz.8]
MNNNNPLLFHACDAKNWRVCIYIYIYIYINIDIFRFQLKWARTSMYINMKEETEAVNLDLRNY